MLIFLTGGEKSKKENTMKSKYMFLLLFLFAIGIAFTGCSEKSENPTGAAYTATEDDYSDASEDAGSTVADPDEGLLTIMSGGGGNSGFSTDGQSGSFPEISDTSYYRHGLQIIQDQTFFASDSSSSETYNPVTTVRIFSGMTIQGTITKPRRTAEIDQAGYVNITGVTPEDAILTFNGSVRRTVSSQFQAGWRGVLRTYNGTHQLTIVNVRIGRDRLFYPYPLSGEIRGTARFTRVKILPNGREKSVSIDTDYTIVFDGTRYAEIRMFAGMSFWLDLTDGECHKERP